ncbi:MAG: helix-turn-helix domain-containing protein [Anaerolineales bacterium]
MNNQNKEFHRLMNAAQVAERLNVSKPLVYKLMQTGKIQCVQINSARRVRSQDLEEFIKSNLSNSLRV